MFGDRATSFAISKGDKVYCEGRLKLESWTSKTGEAKPGLKVAVWKSSASARSVATSRPPKTRKPKKRTGSGRVSPSDRRAG